MTCSLSRNPLGLIAPLILLMVLPACVERTPSLGQSLSRGQDALEAARAAGVVNYSCPKMRVDPALIKINSEDADAGLFSEYLVRVAGCGQSGEYRVSCRAGGPCAIEE